TPANLVANIQAALNTIFGAGATVVSSVSGTVYTITFAGGLANANLAQVTTTSSLTGTSPTVTPSTVNNGSGNEVQTLTVGGTSAGTFTPVFNGVSGTALTFTTGAPPTAADVLASLNAIPGLNGNVTVIGNNAGPFTIVFNNGLGNANLPQMTTTV